MIALAVKITAVLALAALLDLALRRRGSAFTRHLIWTMSVCSVLALPVVSILLPAWRVLPSGVLSLTVAEVESNLAPIPEVRLPQELPTAHPGPPPTLERPVVNEPRRSTVDWLGFALLAYAGVALMLLLRIAAEHLLVARLAQRGAPLLSDEWSALVQSVRAHLGVRRTVDVRAVSGAVMPLACGIIRRRVLLPAAADDWPAERRRAVLLHEIAHVARHDCLTQTMAAIACALYWPHPGVWWAAHRLRVEREHACDALALAGGVPRLEYATHLLEIARAYSAPRFAAGAVAMARSRIELRLRAILAADNAERSLSRKLAAATVLTTFALLVPLAAIAPAAGASPEQRPSGEDHLSPAPARPADGSATSEPAAGDADDPLAESAGDVGAAIADTQAAAAGFIPPAPGDEQPAQPSYGQPVVPAPREPDVLNDELERNAARNLSAPRAAPPATPPQIPTPTTGRWIVSAAPGGGQQLELFWGDGTRWRRRLDPAEAASMPGTRGGTWFIERDAGRLELTNRGTSSNAGLLQFVPNRAFAETLKELGLTRPGGEVPDQDLKVLTWGNVGEAMVSRLRAQFDTLAYSDLIAFAMRATSPE
jgi:beta-lactamase regulating signal transducer with metallopeptidase domain